MHSMRNNRRPFLKFSMERVDFADLLYRNKENRFIFAGLECGGDLTHVFYIKSGLP